MSSREKCTARLINNFIFKISSFLEEILIGQAKTNIASKAWLQANIFVALWRIFLVTKTKVLASFVAKYRYDSMIHLTINNSPLTGHFKACSTVSKSKNKFAPSLFFGSAINFFLFEFLYCKSFQIKKITFKCARLQWYRVDLFVDAASKKSCNINVFFSFSRNAKCLEHL